MHKIVDKALIIIPLLLAGIHTFMLIHYGYIKDDYMNLSHDLDNIIWIGFFLSILALLFVYGFIIVHKQNIAKFILCIFSLVSFALMYRYYHFSKDYPITKIDYIDSNWLQGISLDEIVVDSDDTTLVYIGAENRNEEFEEELIKQCEYYSYQMNTYYINDHDNYSDVLNYYDITKIPILIITQNGQIIDKTSDINELSTIMEKVFI
ncbi:MAG: hypothetical protein LUF02_00995 [Erysipelotrichaceae bacterium]|nr:hypothetical protein [Erysipelotrichaceae bacterium]